MDEQADTFISAFTWLVDELEALADAVEVLFDMAVPVAQVSPSAAPSAVQCHGTVADATARAWRDAMVVLSARAS
jgi:hypothetical protein